MSDYRLLTAGDTGLVVEFGDRVDRRINRKVLALAHRIADARINGIIETVPTFRSLMIYFEPLVLDRDLLIARIDDMMKGLPQNETAGRAWHIPVCYDERLAPDLMAVAAVTRLDPDEIVARHSTATYHVYMLGFLPGQAYMGDLPSELNLPRREVPRLRIPAGSLAIAMNMTCIFPLETPCGWHLIGRSPVSLWDNTDALLAPGDKVHFDPVSFEQYQDLAVDAAEGVLKILPGENVIGAAA